MINLKSYEQRSSIGFVHNLEEAFKTTNPTVAGKIVAILPFVPKSSLQQTSVLIYHVVDASPVEPPNERSEKKFKILFIGDTAETVVTLPIEVGDEVSFRKACFLCDSVFDKVDSFYEKILCIGLPPSLNRLKNMFYRKKDQDTWISLSGLGFQSIPTNIDDYVPFRPGKCNGLYVLKSVEENDSDESSCAGDIPSSSDDEEFTSAQSSFRNPEKSGVDVTGESSNGESNVTTTVVECSGIQMEANDPVVSTSVIENDVSDETAQLQLDVSNSQKMAMDIETSTAIIENDVSDKTAQLQLDDSNSQKIAMDTETSEKSISVAEKQIIIPQKMLNCFLYLMTKTITKYPSKSTELQERAARDVINSPRNAFIKLPKKLPEAPFFIQVSVVATIPYITGTSSNIDILSLISFHCGQCSMYFPFPSVEWQLIGDETLAICLGCKKKGIRSVMDCTMMCEFLLQLEFGCFLSAVVIGENAENFFGCTMSDLCSSSDAPIKIRQVFNSFKKSQEFLVLKVIPVRYGNDEEYRYHIIC